MKKVFVALIIGSVLAGCASDHPQYAASQFNNINYQQTVANAVEYADNFVDFDQGNLPKADLAVVDFSSLMQADIAFNQGNYVTAAETYYILANKYKDPRIIYKAIVCYEHLVNNKVNYARLNSLTELLIQVAPNSNVAKLFGIFDALAKNDISTAKTDLKEVIQANPTKARSVLLFLSSIVSNNVEHAFSGIELDKFAAYVENKYELYPEAHLYAIVSYSISGNQKALFASLDYINQYYPNWEIPVYWSAGLLLRYNRLELLQSMLDHKIKQSNPPSAALQNLYIASLLRTNKLSIANGYVESALKLTPKDGNLLVNSAIINYKLNDYTLALNALHAADSNNYSLEHSVDLAIGSFYDINKSSESAISYYQKVVAANPVLSPAANLGIFRVYLNAGQKKQAEQFLNQLATRAKLNDYDSTVLKISLYTALAKFEDAYTIAAHKISLYHKDKTFIYLYASLSALTNRTEQAIKWYNDYIKLNPNDPSGYNDLGFIYADKTNQYNKANQLAKKAFSMQPNDPAILDTLGWSYYKLGMYELAEKYLLLAYKASGDRDTGLHLRQVYLAEHKTDAAAALVIAESDMLVKQKQQVLLNQAMSILMYYQYGLDFSR